MTIRPQDNPGAIFGDMLIIRKDGVFVGKEKSANSEKRESAQAEI